MINRSRRTALVRHTAKHQPGGEHARALIARLSPQPVTCQVRTDTVELPRLIVTTAVTA